MRKQQGFTLIELLVVIAIIALLLAILMPALQRVKKQAKGVVCRNNMKQIGMAANLYAEDYDLFVPRSADWSTITDMRPWFQCFMPYLAQKAIDEDYRNVSRYFAVPAILTKNKPFAMSLTVGLTRALPGPGKASWLSVNTRPRPSTLPTTRTGHGGP
jgi:prepilin-type N-terminal cleavage/methylation domain-containing protein